MAAPTDPLNWMDALQQPAWLMDPAGNVLRFNAPWQQLTPLLAEQDLQARLHQALPDAHWQDLQRAHQQARASRSPYQLQVTLRFLPGDQQGLLTVSPLQGEGWLALFHPATPAALPSRPLQALLNDVPVGLAFFDRDLRFQALTPSMAQINGVEVEASLGRTLSDLFPGRMDRVEGYMQQVLDTGIPLLDIEVYDRDLMGDTHDRYWLLNYFPVRSGDEVLGVGVTAQDITARKKAEKELHQQAHFLGEVTRTTPVLVYLFDLSTGKTTFVNERVQDVLGYTVQELLSMDTPAIRNLIHPDEQQTTADFAQQLRVAGVGTVLSRVHRVRHKQGHWIWVQSHQTVFSRTPDGTTQVLGANIDISELKATQHQLEESEQRFQAIADGTPVMLWQSDHQGRCTYLNRTWLEFTGLQPEDALGDGWMRVIHPEDLQEAVRAFQEAEQGRKLLQHECRFLHHSGVYRWVLDCSLPRFTRDGQYLGFIGAVMDIHDRKTTEEALREREAELRRVMDAQKKFVADAAHEIRTPLAAIQGNLDILIRYPQLDPEEKRDVLNEAQRETLRLGRLVSDLLTLARGDAGQVFEEHELEPGKLILEVFREARRQWNTHHFRVEGLEEVQLFGDPDRLRQLLWILLENAVKYGPAGGDIGVSLRKVGGCVELRLSDQGMGIPAGELERVFERFYRADPSRTRKPGDPGGTGLGLSIAKWIVEGHQGKIWLESQPGEGTTAVVQLPLAGAKP